ncbi:hypothetical protein L1887_49849 [Cichorium endivia]|nr:hypothetical protein L1887_49849 [Cichorium endivia]
MCNHLDAETDAVSRSSQYYHGVPLPSHQAWLNTVRCLLPPLSPGLLLLRRMCLKFEVPCTVLRQLPHVQSGMERRVNTFTSNQITPSLLKAYRLLTSFLAASAPRGGSRDGEIGSPPPLDYAIHKAKRRKIQTSPCRTSSQIGPREGGEGGPSDGHWQHALYSKLQGNGSGWVSLVRAPYHEPAWPACMRYGTNVQTVAACIRQQDARERASDRPLPLGTMIQRSSNDGMGSHRIVMMLSCCWFERARISSDAYSGRLGGQSSQPSQASPVRPDLLRRPDLASRVASRSSWLDVSMMIRRTDDAMAFRAPHRSVNPVCLGFTLFVATN